jgi:hypothetical protein
MKNTEVTYSQLDQVLRSLGFSCRVLTKDAPSRVYEHKESGAIITLPPLPMTDSVLARHLAAARMTVDLFGIADPKLFDAKLQKAG